MDFIIVLIEGIAAIFFIVAILFFIKVAKKEKDFGKILASIVVLAMFIAALASLADVFEWLNVYPHLMEDLEEVFLLIFGAVWLAASFTIYSFFTGNDKIKRRFSKEKV